MTTSRGTRSTRLRVAALGAAVSLSIGLAACGGEPGQGPTDTPTAAITPTSNATTPTESATPAPSTPTINPSEVSTLPGGNGMAIPLLIDESFLPVGWNATQPRDSGGFRMTICGVDIEPQQPIDAATKMWQKAPEGPWLEQHVRVYDTATARNVLAALKEAMPTCKQYTATDDKGGSSTFAVSPLTLRSADQNVVSWRQRLVVPAAPTAAPSPTGSPAASPARSGTPRATASRTPTAAPSTPATPTLTQDVAVARIGSSTVMLVSYAVNETPSVALLDAALSAALVMG